MREFGRTLCNARVVTVDAQCVLAEAEAQIEAWLCELDVTWTRILADARIEALEIVAGARAEAESLLEDGRTEAATLVREAETRAAELVTTAELESRTLLTGSARLASMQLSEAQTEVRKARALAVESSATAAALANAAGAVATGRVQVDDLAALGSAVLRLRTELSRVVDAAFDALPAVEATAAALRLEEVVATLPPPPAPAPASHKRASTFRRLLRI